MFRFWDFFCKLPAIFVFFPHNLTAQKKKELERMKKTATYFTIFCFATFFLWGCTQSHNQSLCQVVTAVDISCQEEDVPIRRHYTQTQKMEAVLLYLRLIKPLGKPAIDPESLPDAEFQITVHLSDGTQKVYYQKDHRYFAKEHRLWQSIDPEQASGLYSLMRRLPSDKL